jgi:glucose/mannose transport system permease protein
LIALFVHDFIANTFWISLTDWRGAAALADHPAKHFVGLKNYGQLFFGFLGGGFRQDLVNADFYSVMLLAGAVRIGMSVAVLLDDKPKGEDIFRTIFLYPMSLSLIVTGTVWRWMLAPQSGVNLLPTFFGGKPMTFRWLTST